MILTGIGEKNHKFFRPIMSDLSLDDHELRIGAIENNEAVGVALFNWLGDALMLDYIYVCEDYRRRGIGCALIKEALLGIGKKRPLAIHVNYPEESAELHEFFKALRFKIYRDGISWRIPVRELMHSANFKKLIAHASGNNTMETAELTFKNLSILKKGMSREKLDPSILEDKRINKKFSLATTDTNANRPVACILCEQEGNQLVIIYLVNFTKDVKRLVDLFNALKETVIESGLTDNDLLFVTMDERMEALAKTLSDSSDSLIIQGKVISAIYMADGFGNTLLGEAIKSAQPSGPAFMKTLSAVTAASMDDETAARCFYLRALSRSQRTKRGLKFTDKARLQAAMLKTMLEIYDKWSAGKEILYEAPALLDESNPANDNPLIQFLNFTTPENRQHRENFEKDIDLYNHYNEKHRIIGDTPREKQDAVLSLLENTSYQIFEYSTDEEFLSGAGKGSLAERYSLIRLISHSVWIINENRAKITDNRRLNRLQTLSRAAYDILSDYEYRAILIQSPYYSLLASRDLDKMPDLELKNRTSLTEDEAVRMFLEQILIKRKKKSFAKGQKVSQYI